MSDSSVNFMGRRFVGPAPQDSVADRASMAVPDFAGGEYGRPVAVKDCIFVELTLVLDAILSGMNRGWSN